MNDENLPDLCRVCLTCSHEMIDLQSELKTVLETNVNFVHQALGRVVKKEIVLDPTYPMYICGLCCSFLNLAYKFVVDYEKSEAVLKEHFNLGDFNDALKTEATVEIISANGRFDANDLVIVEEEDDKPEGFDGFLRNLGTEVSAFFVENDEEQVKKKKTIDVYDVTIRQLSTKNIEVRNEEGVSSEEAIMEITDKKPTETTEIINKGDKKVENSNQCEICSKTFKKKLYLLRHIRQIHTKPDSCLCQICGYLAENKQRLQYHLAAKHNGRQFTCEYCEKNFISKGHLQTHMQSHKNARTYLCTVCGKDFNYSNSLEYHMRTHTGEKRYQCQYCPRKFAVACALKRHTLAHTGIRPYKCRYCDRGFRSSGERNCHEMRHTGDRPFCCKHCGRGFIKGYNLNVHLLTHKGKHRCDVCNKGFIELDYLRVHNLAVHGGQLLEEDQSD